MVKPKHIGQVEGRLSEFVQNDEVHPGQMLRKTALPSVAGFGLEAVDEVDHVAEAVTGTGSDAASGDGNARWVLPVPVPPTSTLQRRDHHASQYRNELISNRGG
jgi:hypothetical protein